MLLGVLLLSSGMDALPVRRQQSQSTQAKKSYVINFDADTPDSAVNAAMDDIRSRGGVVTHQYKYTKSYSVDMSGSVRDEFSTKSDQEQWQAFVQEDITMGMGKRGEI